MYDEKCTLPNCKKLQAYRTLKVCRACYSRIWHLAKVYNGSMEKIKNAVVELDGVAIKHGLTGYVPKHRD